MGRPLTGSTIYPPDGDGQAPCLRSTCTPSRGPAAAVDPTQQVLFDDLARRTASFST